MAKINHQKYAKIKEMGWCSRRFRLSVLSLIIISMGMTTALILVQKRQTPKKKATGRPSITFAQTSTTVHSNTDFNVAVKIDTNNNDVCAADIILQFPQEKLTLQEINPHPNASFKTFTPVTSNGSFDTSKVISNANTTGKIEFGAVTFDWQNETITNPFKGTANPLATLKFHANSTGQAKIAILVSSGSTIDSNLVNLSAQDILESVNSLTVNITNPPINSPTATPTASLPPSTLPPTTTFTPPTLTPSPPPPTTGTDRPSPTPTPPPTSTPIPPECINNKDCNDDNLCTTDTCANGSCEYTPISCNEHAECNPRTGNCQCSSDNWGNCDNSWGNGCETSLTDKANCGACGNQCGSNEICQEKKCVKVGEYPTCLINQMAKNLGIDIKYILSTEDTNKQWPDSCLGCPEPNKMCATVITAGKKLVLQSVYPDSNNKCWQYEYHTAGAADDLAIHCVQYKTCETKEIDCSQCPANGDFNGDGKVDEFDYGILIAHFGEEGIPGEVAGDANCDGIVDEFDYGILIAHFGEGE